MAGLIPQNFIDELLNRVDIVDVVDRRVTLKKAGKNHQACCPFHQEKTPSFSVQPERQFFYCFGCGAGGNAVGFVMKFHNIGFPEAVEVLARDAGMEVPRQESPGDARRGAEQRALFDCLEQASKFYQRQLRQHPNRSRAVGWCKSRGISGVTAREFLVGYAPPGRKNLLQALGADETARDRLLKAGLVIEDKRNEQDDTSNSQMYDRFRNRVVFPIRDSRGRTVGFGARVLDDSKPKYLNSPETPVFHKGRELYGLYEARKSKAGKLLLVEGYMDVIALAQAGIHNAVATLGTSTSDWQIQRMFRQVPEVVFCFDGDEAGRRAAWRALETTLPLMADGKGARFLFLPEGEDPDSMVGKLGAEKFLALVDAAEPLETFFFDHLSEGPGIESIEGKAALSSKAMPLIGKLPKGVYRQLMIDRLAEITGVDKKTLVMPAMRKQDSQPPPWSRELPTREQTPISARPPERFSRYKQHQSSPLQVMPKNLVAVQLLLRAPKVVITASGDPEHNFSMLKTSEDEGTALLAELIEMVSEDPHKEHLYFILLEHCYKRDSVRGLLTLVLTGEKITPPDGIEGEFLDILVILLSESSRKIEEKQRRDKLRAQFAAKG